MILTAFLLGMVLCALTLALLRAEDGHEADRFASAVAMFAGWCAFGMLMMAGIYGLGLLIPALAGGAVLMARTVNPGAKLNALNSYKMTLGIGALLMSVFAWIGVLNLMEDLPDV